MPGEVVWGEFHILSLNIQGSGIVAATQGSHVLRAGTGTSPSGTDRIMIEELPEKNSAIGKLARLTVP